VREALHVGLAVNPGTPIARMIDVLDDIGHEEKRP